MQVPCASADTIATALCLPVPVCPSQVGVLSKQLNEWDSFWHGSFIRPILQCIVGKFGDLDQTLNLRNFRHDRSIVEMCHQLSSTKVDAHSVINWTRSAKLTTSPTVDR